MFDTLVEVTSSTHGFEILEEKVNPTSTWKSLKIRGIFQRADSKNQNGRIYPYKVLDKALQEAKESLLSRNMLGELDHPCLTDSNFNVLTENGWKRFLDIQVGEKVWSLSNGIASLATVENVINQQYNGDVYTFSGRNIKSTFTAPHKLLLNNRSGIGEFKASVAEISENKSKYYHSPIPKTAQVLRSSVKNIIIPAIKTGNNSNTSHLGDLIVDAKIFSAFMGIYLSEGHSSKNSYHVFISQKVEWTKEYIKTEILDKLSNELVWHEYNNGFGVNDARLNAYLKPLGNKYTKYVPKEIKNLDSACLKELLFWFGIGDGRLVGPKDNQEDVSIKQSMAKSIRKTLKSKYLKFQLFSVSEKLIQDLHECLFYCGESGTKTVIITEKDYKFAGRLIKAENKVPLHILNISSAKNIYISKGLSIKKSLYNGNIYCLTTSNGNFYMEQNGKSFWTGNCDQSPTISLKNVSHVITSLKFSGNDLIGEALIFDDPGPAGTPSGRVLGALVRNNCTVGISSRGFGAVSETYDGSIVDDYKLCTFDMVQDPSTQKAFIQQVNEGVDFKRQLERELERRKFIEDLRSLFSVK